MQWRVDVSRQRLRLAQKRYLMNRIYLIYHEAITITKKYSV